MCILKLIRSWGNEEDIQKYVRLSYGKQEKDITNMDVERLITLLLKKEHYSMFEFQGMEVQATVPIFIQRQWMRHRIFSYHEISRRYTEITEKDIETVEYKIPVDIMEILKQQIKQYKELLDNGHKKEEQRGIIGTYFPTTFLCSGNLRQWLHFIKLRSSDHQQKEIQQCQNIVFNSFIQDKFPLTYKNFKNIIERQ